MKLKVMSPQTLENHSSKFGVDRFGERKDVVDRT